MNKSQYIFFLNLMLTINSCTNCKIDIPNNEEITELIYETIVQDSLEISRPINTNLVNRYIYHLQRDSILGYLPAPPRNNNGEPFVFSRYLGDTSISLGFSITDSTFIANQILLNRDIVIDTNNFPDYIKFESFPWMNYEKQNLYIFLIPIINKDRNHAIVEYEYRSVCCGYGIIVFFKRVNNKWIKVDSYGTWTS